MHRTDEQIQNDRLFLADDWQLFWLATFYAYRGMEVRHSYVILFHRCKTVRHRFSHFCDIAEKSF